MLEGSDADPDRILDLVKPDVTVFLLFPASHSNIPNLTIISRYYRIAQEIPVPFIEQLIPAMRENYQKNLIVLGAQYIDDRAGFDFYQPTTVPSSLFLPPELAQYAKVLPSFSFVIMPHTIAIRQAIWIAAQTVESLETDDPILKSSLALAYGWRKMDIVPQIVSLLSSPLPIQPRDTTVPPDLSEYLRYPGLKRLDGLVYIPREKSGGYWRGLLEDEGSFHIQRKMTGPWLIPRVLHIVGTPSDIQLAQTRWSLMLKKGWKLETHDISQIDIFPNEWKMIMNLPSRQEIYSMAILNLYGGFVVSAKMVPTNGLPEWWRRYELVVPRNGARITSEIVGSIPGGYVSESEVKKPWTGRAALMRDKMAELERDRQKIYDVRFFTQLRDQLVKGISLDLVLEELVNGRLDGNYLVIPKIEEYLTQPATPLRTERIVAPTEHLPPIRSHIVTPESVMAELRGMR